MLCEVSSLTTSNGMFYSVSRNGSTLLFFWSWWMLVWYWGAESSVKYFMLLDIFLRCFDKLEIRLSFGVYVTNQTCSALKTMSDAWESDLSINSSKGACNKYSSLMCFYGPSVLRYYTVSTFWYYSYSNFFS